MKNLIAIFILNLIFSSAYAARLENVKILNIISEEDGIELKLHTPSGEDNSYFFVRIEKDDVETFDKLICILQKQNRPNKIKLNLEIPSFSHSPNGSSYPGHSVRFSLKEEPSKLYFDK